MKYKFSGIGNNISNAQFLCFVKTEDKEVIGVREIHDPDIKVYMLLFVAAADNSLPSAIVTDLDTYAFCDFVSYSTEWNATDAHDNPIVVSHDVELSKNDMNVLRKAVEIVI